MPTIALKCPVAAGAAAIVGPDIAGFVQAIPNQFALQLPDISGSQQIAIPTLTIGADVIEVDLLPMTYDALIFREQLHGPHP
jgi:hypothetical protein